VNIPLDNSFQFGILRAHLARPEKSKAALIRRLFAFTAPKMTASRYLKAYQAQRSGAKSRGIEFHLTFKEWCDFWGEDIGRRGTGPNDLQMQRIGDSGPYALGNIKKGVPRQNAKTAGLVRRTRSAELGARYRKEQLDRLMTEESGEERWLDDDEHEFAKLGYASMSTVRYKYAADK
jgi:hypothetical protein